MKHLKATSALMLKIILGNKWHIFKKNRVDNLKFAHDQWKIIFRTCFDQTKTKIQMIIYREKLITLTFYETSHLL